MNNIEDNENNSVEDIEIVIGDGSNLEFSEVFESRIDAMFENFESVGSYLIEYDVDDDLVINEINGRIPDVLVCSFKSPIQEKWIVENKTKMNVKMCVALSGEREDLFSKKETGLKWIAKLFEKSSVFGVTMF